MKAERCEIEGCNEKTLLSPVFCNRHGDMERLCPTHFYALRIVERRPFLLTFREPAREEEFRANVIVTAENDRALLIAWRIGQNVQRAS